MPTYTPSVFSRNTTKLTSFGPRPFSGHSRSCSSLTGPVVDVEIELEPRAEQNVARVTVVGYARIAERADENRVEPAQRVVPVRRDRDAGLQIVIRAPRQLLELERPAILLPDRLDHFHRFGRDFAAYSIAWDYGNLERLSLHLSLARGAPPPLALARRRRSRGASFQRLARAAGASLSLSVSPRLCLCLFPFPFSLLSLAYCASSNAIAMPMPPLTQSVGQPSARRRGVASRTAA